MGSEKDWVDMMLMNLFAEIDISKLFGLAIRTSIGVQAATFALAAVGLNLHYVSHLV